VHPDLVTLVQLGDSYAELPKRFRREVVVPAGDHNCRRIRSYGESPACYLIKHFDDTGYVIVRSDWAISAQNASMLFAQGGFFNQTHRDADDLTFEWFERGRRILSDGGGYGVTGGEWRQYFESTRAHNTVEVGGEDYRDTPYGSAVERVERLDDSVRIVMEVHHESLDVVHRRVIDYRPGKELRLTDALRSDRPEPRRLVQWHHFPREFELTGKAGRFQADDGELVVDINVSSSCGDRTTYETIKGQTKPRIQGWASSADREHHPRWALGVVCEAETASFSAVFTLGQ
jgi:hypothetical protein